MRGCFLKKKRHLLSWKKLATEKKQVLPGGRRNFYEEGRKGSKFLWQQKTWMPNLTGGSPITEGMDAA